MVYNDCSSVQSRKLSNDKTKLLCDVGETTLASIIKRKKKSIYGSDSFSILVAN